MSRTQFASGLLTGVLLTIPVAGLAGDHSHEGHSPGGDEPTAAAQPVAEPRDEVALLVAKQRASYPLTVCPVSGEELGSMGDPIDFLHEGRLVRFCCGTCEEQFTKNPAKVLAEIDAAVVETQRDAYALETCPISGMKLGGMGEPYDHVHGTRLVRFCCGSCRPKFDEDPEAAMAKVDAALVEAQKATYPHTMCPVTAEMPNDAMGEPYDILYGTRLVRLCCEACVGEFWKSPEKYVAMLEEPTPE
jgi:YHS domain-containing protein